MRWTNRVEDRFHSRKDMFDSSFICLDPVDVSRSNKKRFRVMNESKEQDAYNALTDYYILLNIAWKQVATE